MPSLVRADGTFLNVARGLGFRHRRRRRDVEAELAAQLERFTEVAGCLPDHLDSHQLIGSLSAVCRQVMLDLADEYRLPVRQGGRQLFDRFEREFAGRVRLHRALAPSHFRHVPRKRHARVYDRTPRSPDRFEYGFHKSMASAEGLLLILDALPEGLTELVCHPGYLGGEADGYRYREVELAALKDDRVKEKMAESGVVLSTFAALAAPLPRRTGGGRKATKS